MKPRTWNKPLPEVSLLGGEQRFSSALPQHNQGWILRLIPDHPPVPAVETQLESPGTKFQLFPRFSDSTKTSLEPVSSSSTPFLESFSWDWIEFKYQPLKDLEVRSIYWVPDPSVICGEYWITNRTRQSRDVFVDLVCLLQYHGAGNQIVQGEINGRPVLTGSLGGQNITLFLAGNPVFNESPFPYLQTKLSLEPDKAEKIHWVCILSNSHQAALDILTAVLQLDWQGEISRRKVKLQGELEITTGDPDWDFALEHAQRLSLLRYNQLKSAKNRVEIDPIQGLMLLQALICPTPEMIKNILDLALANSGQSDRTPPLLVGELLWQTYKMGISKEIWADYLERAVRSLEDWFSPNLDKDGDGIPELVNPEKLFRAGSNAATKNSLLPYPFLESPALSAVIYDDLRKIDDLLQIAGFESTQRFEERKDTLKSFIQDSWNSESNEFQNRDYISHASVSGFDIFDNLQPGLNILRESFPQPSRIGVLHHRTAPDQPPGEFSVVFHGQDWCGNYRIEELNSGDFIYGEGMDWGITECVYSKLDYSYLKIHRQAGQINLIAPSTSIEDITQTLPLWAGALPESQTREIIDNVLLDPDRYWSPFGFRSNPESEQADMYLNWNLLLGETLHDFGMKSAAARLIERWMEAVIPPLNESGSSYPGYGIHQGQGAGLKDSLESIFPVRFFLQVLGIELLQDGQLTIEGLNPFPWPVTIKFRGTEIKRGETQTLIIRPGKETIILADPDKFQIDLN